MGGKLLWQVHHDGTVQLGKSAESDYGENIDLGCMVRRVSLQRKRPNDAKADAGEYKSYTGTRKMKEEDGLEWRA